MSNQISVICGGSEWGANGVLDRLFAVAARPRAALVGESSKRRTWRCSIVLALMCDSTFARAGATLRAERRFDVAPAMRFRGRGGVIVMFSGGTRSPISSKIAVFSRTPAASGTDALGCFWVARYSRNPKTDATWGSRSRAPARNGGAVLELGFRDARAGSRPRYAEAAVFLPGTYGRYPE